MEYDFLALGSGIAGLTFALNAAPHSSVAILTKKQRSESNTNYAQGGIAAALGADDSWELHLHDTLIAGAGLCARDAVEVLAREGPRLVHWGTELEFVIMVIAVSCVKLLSAHNSTQHTSRKHKV
jgi:L-aspartate oxidase (EC 1.4.3.16)